MAKQSSSHGTGGNDAVEATKKVVDPARLAT